MLTDTKGRKDWWGRLAYERMPMFCYECGIIGHVEAECFMQNQLEVGGEKVMQYGDWLRASPVEKRFNKTYGENHSRSNRFLGFEANGISNQGSQKTQAAKEKEKVAEGVDRSNLRTVAATTHVVARNLNFECNENKKDDDAITMGSIIQTKITDFQKSHSGTDKDDFLNKEFVEISLGNKEN
ncbi:hypothetical protein CRYUN_Cryun11dG0074300 [Craigia yunnanensis]